MIHNTYGSHTAAVFVYTDVNFSSGLCIVTNFKKAIDSPLAS